MDRNYELVRAGELAVLLCFGNEISDETTERVGAAFTRLMTWAPPELLNLHPAYASLLVEFRAGGRRYRTLVAALEEALASVESRESPSARLVEVPVIYGGESGPDLASVAERLGLSPESVIRLHSGREYRAHFLGFRPGFPYLGLLPEELRLPRLSSPRRRVAAGSVAIAERQTGIYPLASPGGWHVIGRTSLSLFRPLDWPPVRIGMGDRVRFRPVTGEERRD